MRKTHLDFAKLSEMDRKKETHFDHITTILEENNLVRKQIPEGAGSLSKAISDSLYFTSHYHNEIQQFCIKHLHFMIAENKLPAHLNMFKGNSTLWKDFSAHPHLPGFEKIILELVSILFKVKVILYSVTEDGYLNATVINHQNDKAIELIRSHGNHFDSVRSKRFMAIAGICQNVLLNVIEQVVAGKTAPSASAFKDLNADAYVNLEYEAWLVSKEELAKEGAKVTRARHKKSLSDNFNVNFDAMEEQQIKFYNMFVNDKPPEDFIKLLSKDRKETADNLGLHADIRYNAEPWYETPQADLAIKNYPVSSSNLSSRVNSLQDLHLVDNKNEYTSKNNLTTPSKAFFNESLTPLDLKDMEKDQNSTPSKDELSTQMSPAYFVHSPPPGLTPSRYPQKTYSTENAVFTLQTPDKARATSQIFDYTPEHIGINNMFPMMSTPPLTTNYSNPHFTNSNSGGIFRKSPNNVKNLMLATCNYGEDLSQLQVRSETNLDHTSLDQNKIQPFASAEKRKPIILDEGKVRCTGRLKFFDENKNYGFIIMDEDGSDIFVHYDDLQKAGINKEFLKNARMGQVIKLAFNCMRYIGKYDKSRKATDIQLLN